MDLNKWIQHNKMVDLYTPLFDIIHYYDTIMTLITIIAISSLFAVVEVSIF